MRAMDRVGGQEPDVEALYRGLGRVNYFPEGKGQRAEDRGQRAELEVGNNCFSWASQNVIPVDEMLPKARLLDLRRLWTFLLLWKQTCAGGG